MGSPWSAFRVSFRGSYFGCLLRERILRARVVEDDVGRYLRQGGAGGFAAGGARPVAPNLSACRLGDAVGDDLHVVNRVSECLYSPPILRFSSRYLAVAGSAAGRAGLFDGVVDCLRIEYARVGVVHCR